MVDHISLAVPFGTKVDNPLEDVALMARIGAKQIGSTKFGTEYELTNATTGTRFTFEWAQWRSNGFGVLQSHWRLTKEE